MHGEDDVVLSQETLKCIIKLQAMNIRLRCGIYRDTPGFVRLDALVESDGLD